jgi:RNA polymerase sigma factor (sigma-70 family)
MYNMPKNIVKLSREEERELLANAQSGCLSSRNLLIECNIPLLIKLAKKYKPPHLEIEDCINAGVLGLVTAIKKWDLKRTTKFMTYAKYWIWHAISVESIYNRLVHIPQYVLEKARKDRELNKLVVKLLSYCSVNSSKHDQAVDHQWPDLEPDEKTQKLHSLMCGLGTTHRDIVRMRLEGKSYVEIQRKLRIGYPTIRVKEQSAMHYLKEKLGNSPIL